MSGLQDEIAALTAQVAALTARVYQLEQGPGPVKEGPLPPETGQAATPRVSATVSGTERTPLAQPPPRESPVAVREHRQAHLAAPPREEINLEKKIGQYWLNRIGIVAILIGASYFLKYAFENNWIGPTGRVASGLLTGAALVVWSDRFRAKGYLAFSHSLKAIGIGTLYLSLWSAFQLYHLIPSAVAFAAMVMVTGLTIVLALTQNAQLLAIFALIGGFSTPVLLSTGQNQEMILFSYVCLLDLAVLAMVIAKPWRHLLWGSFTGTVILYVGWNLEYYSVTERSMTVAFLSAFAAIFAVVPLATRYRESTRFQGPSVTLTLVALFNAGLFFLALYPIYGHETATLTWYALGLAAVYWGIGTASKRRFPAQDTNFLHLLHVAIAIGFITIAIPLKMDAQWITIGWLIESAVLLWIAGKAQTGFLRFLALVALALGILRLLLFDHFHTETLVFNARFATYLVAVATLGAITYFDRDHASANEGAVRQLLLVLLNLLALIALTAEASDYFDRQSALSYRLGLGAAEFLQLRLAREFSYSAIWLSYGACLMTVGFHRRSAFIRWQSLLLIAVTIVKVFLYDVAALDKGYRILSFVVLGAVLLGISFVYQRDWLKLSARSAEERAAGAP